MSSKVLEVKLRASDAMSAVFAKAGNSAKTMGDAVKRAGTDAKQGLSDLDDDAKRVGQSFQNLDLDMRKIGASAGIITAAFGLAGQSTRDHQRDIEALNRMYGELAAQGLLDFAEGMENLTNVTDDQAIAMANTMGTLVQNYDMSVAQIETLIARTADLAALKGKSYEEAAAMVQSAMRGEAEYAEQLGLTLNDAALGIDRMSKSTTDAQKAGVRFNAFLEQSAYASGYAEEAADGYYGKLVDLRDTLQDVTQDFMGAAGPMAEFGAFLGDNAVQAAALTLALGQLGSTAGMLNTAIGGNLLFKTGAAGLGIGALVVGTMAAMEAAWPDDERFHEFDEKFEATAQKAQKAIYATQAVGDQASADIGQFALDALVGADEAIARMVELNGHIAMNERAIAQGASDLIPETEQMREELAELQAIYGDATIAQEDYANGAIALNNILLNQGTGRQQALEELRELNEQFANHEISPDDYIKDLITIGSSLTTYDAIANKTIETNAALKESMESVFSGVGTIAGEVISDIEALGETSAKTIKNAGEVGKIAAEGLRSIGDVVEMGLFRVRKFWQPIIDQWEEVDRLTDQFTAKWEQTRMALTGPAEALSAGFTVVVSNTNAIASQSQAVADWAEELIKAEGVYSKLDELVNAGRISGTSGVFDDGSQYAQAQQAYNSIMEDNAAIQEHVLTIQAKQAPMLAQMESNLESYLAALANATPEEQAFALAMMDSTTAAQAFDLSMGILENRDVFGPMAEQVANLNPYIGEALVQMGLMTKTLDESTGTYVYELVAETETAQSQISILTEAIEALNKTFTIAFGIEVDTGPLDNIRDALNPWGGGSEETAGSSGLTVTVTADTSAATEAIDGVTSTTIPDKTAVILGDDTAAMAAIGDVENATIGDKTAVVLGDNRSAVSAINSVNNMAVYDKTMTINVITAYSSTGTPSIGARHGGVPGYAHGGIPVELAEAGRELLHFANGGVLPISDRGIYAIPEHTYVSPNNAVGNTTVAPTIQITIAGNVYGIDDLERQLAGAVSDAWVQAMRIHERSHGAVG
jgi:hypothetical protein